MLEVSGEPVAAFECPICSHPIAPPPVGPLEKMVCPRCQSDILVPAKFGNFLLLEKLGDGITGPMYRALDLTLNRQVALKVMMKIFAMNPQLVEAFRLQAASAATILHPNIITIYSFGAQNEHYYIAMELIRGKSLHAILRQGVIEERDLLNVAFRISEALQFATSSGMIHGDVRPQNIFIDQDGTPKIGDFGIAQAMASSGFRNLVWSSPYYTPPERAEDRPPDMRGDLYGLGATLFHALVGRPPFDGTDPEDVIARKKNQDAPDVRTLDNSLHARTASILGRLLERNPARRYPTHDSLQGDLAEVLHELDAENTPPPPPPSRGPISEKTASRKIASQKVASQRVPSQKLGSQRLGSQRLTSQRLASQKLSSQKLLSQKLRSQQLGSVSAYSEKEISSTRPGAVQEKNASSLRWVLWVLVLLTLGGLSWFIIRAQNASNPTSKAPTSPPQVTQRGTKDTRPIEQRIPSLPGFQFRLAAEQGVEIGWRDRVVYWRDSVRNQRIAEQPLSGLQPLFQRMSLAGRPALIFDNSLLASLPQQGNFHEGTIFAVFRLDTAQPTTGDAQRILFSMGSSSYPLEHLAIATDRADPSTLGIRVARQSLLSMFQNRRAVGEWNILEVHLEAGAQRIIASCSLNGMQAWSDILPYMPGAEGPWRLWIGGIEARDAGFRGAIATLLVFNKPLTPELRQEIGSYLSAYHDIPSRYPARSSSDPGT